MNFTTKDLIPVAGAIVLFGGIAVVLLMQPGNQKVTSFEECIAAGFPAMESYPRQCQAGGTTFTEIVTNPPEGGQVVEENPATTPTPESDMIVVTLPPADAVVSSPFTVRGKARGMWYFEASFPVLLLDGNGEELAAGVAQAQGDWMTENFVPFSVELAFDESKTDTGVLIMIKDNPSGLPEHDASLKIPVRFR